MVKVEYTHKGWFLFCPIWLADIESEAPYIAPRYKLDALLWLADQFFYLMSAAYEMQTGEPLPFCFRISGKLKKPVVHTYA